MEEDGSIVLTVKDLPSSVQTAGALIEEHLARLQVHGVQSAVVVLDLDRPGLVVVIVLVGDVHDRGDDVGVDLQSL